VPAAGTDPPTLIAVAHGSRDPAAAAATRALLAAVAAARPGLTVLSAYLDHEQPRLAEAVAAASAAGSAPPVVVPLLLGAAYHSRVDIPAALAGTAARQAEVLGPDPLLLRALERRLAEAGIDVVDPSVAVVLAAAGSTDDAAVDGVRDLADSWRPVGWRDVRAAFVSAAAPAVEAAVATLRAEGATRVAVASYLLFPGLFADKLAAAGADVTSAPLTNAPEVVDLVLRRYDAAAP
jgi:sirohydrochlorin ferrochelatase